MDQEEDRIPRSEGMFEEHRIVGEPSGEPLPVGRVGVRLRVPLSGSPSPRWSRDLSARLSNELTGHAAVGHLRLNDIVQGDHIVLEGVEAREAPNLADALRRAVDAANQACATAERPSPAAPNVTQGEAREIARQVPLPTASDRPMGPRRRERA
jgi:hypothetical protein